MTRTNEGFGAIVPDGEQSQGHFQRHAEIPNEAMMGDDDDAALAELLKKDARESSIKYSAMGLEAFMPKR